MCRGTAYVGRSQSFGQTALGPHCVSGSPGNRVGTRSQRTRGTTSERRCVVCHPRQLAMIMTSCSDNSANTFDIGFSSLLWCAGRPLSAVAFHYPDLGPEPMAGAGKHDTNPQAWCTPAHLNEVLKLELFCMQGIWPAQSAWPARHVARPQRFRRKCESRYPMNTAECGLNLNGCSLIAASASTSHR